MLPHRSSTSLTSGLSHRIDDGTLMLAGLYFLSSASTFLWAYMPSQMTALGWTGTQIGLFFTVKTISQAVATPAWAQLADHPDKSRSHLLKLQFVLAAIAIAALPIAGSWSVGIVVAILIGATLRCAPPLMDTVTLGTVGLDRFGHIRAFGTAGFGVVALLFGILGAQLDRELLASSAPWLMFGLVALAVPLTSYLPTSSPTRRPTGSKSGPAFNSSLPGLRTLLKSPVVLVVFPVAALFVATYVPYDLFLVKLADERGFGAWIPGLALFVGVIGELFGYLTFRNFAHRLSPELVIGTAVAITGTIWVLTGITTNPVLFVGLQILTGLTFAAFFLAILDIMTRHFGSKMGAKTQGLLYLLVFTSGNGLGTLLAGIGYDLGSAISLFYGAGLTVFALLPCLLGALWFTDRRAPDRTARLPRHKFECVRLPKPRLRLRRRFFESKPQ